MKINSLLKYIIVAIVLVFIVLLIAFVDAVEFRFRQKCSEQIFGKETVVAIPEQAIDAHSTSDLAGPKGIRGDIPYIVSVIHYPKLADGHDWMLFYFTEEREELKTTTFVHDPECVKCRENRYED